MLVNLTTMVYNPSQPTTPPMPYPIHTVLKFSRRTRAAQTVASGLTMDAASNLARTLRHQNADTEHLHGYRIGTLTLEEQADLRAAGETTRTLRQAA